MVEVTNPQPPVVTIGPEDTRSPTGDTVSLHCEASGEPAAEIRWTKNGNNVNLSDERLTQESGFLIIADVSTSDSGAYVCIATNALG